jgi:glycogen debranching enzyme
MIAAGLKSYGFYDDALRIFDGIYHAATLFPLYRLPEVFAGFSKEQYPRPVRYPVACSPQAWAAGALPYLLQTVLGVVPNALDAELRVVNPILPDFLDQVTLRGIRVGPDSVDLRYQRSGEATLVAVVGRKGNVKVEIEY